MDNIKAQDKLLKHIERICKFIPKDGFCIKCKHNILSKYKDILEVKEEITGCPYCNYSYVD